jgi:hypothetical protein
MKDVTDDSTVKAKFLIGLVKKMYGCEIKHGKAWKAKANALWMLYGDWEEAYSCLPRLLGVIAYRNPRFSTVSQNNPECRWCDSTSMNMILG